MNTPTAIPLLIKSKVSHTVSFVCPSCNVGTLNYHTGNNVMECNNCNHVFSPSLFPLPRKDGEYANICIEPDTDIVSFLDPATSILSGSILYSPILDSHFLFVFNADHRMFVMFPYNNEEQQILDNDPLDAHGSLAKAELQWEVIGTTIGSALKTSCNGISSMFLPEDVIPNSEAAQQLKTVEMPQ